MGVIGELFDIVGDVVALPFKIAGAVVEFGNDVGELVAQDVKNKIEGNPEEPIRTSYDVRDEADKIIDTARKDFSSARCDLDSAWYETSKNAGKVADRRQEVYALLGKATSSALTELPDKQLRLLYPSSAPSVDVDFHIGTFAGALGTNMRMEAAEEYLLEANEYRVETMRLIADVNALRRTVLNVSDAQKEEMAMLDMIQSAYQAKSRSVLTESAGLLREIAELCVQEVCSNTDSKYQDLLRRLKQLWN